MLLVWILPSIACTRSMGDMLPTSTTRPFVYTQNLTPGVTILPYSTPTPNYNLTPAITILPYSSPTFDPNFTPYVVPTVEIQEGKPILYYTQSGDTLPQLAIRFGVSVEEIVSSETLPPNALLSPNTLLVIPNRMTDFGPSDLVMPDSEVVFSPTASNFDVYSFVMEAGGYLSTFTEWHTGGMTTGVDVLRMVATDNSINPRLLLALLEYQSHWVYGYPADKTQKDYPMGFIDPQKKGLYLQLSWAVQQLSIGYYGWRAGLMTDVRFSNGQTIRLAPTLNAGSVAVQNVLSRLYETHQWQSALYGNDSLPALHERMFGNFWIRSQSVEPLYPPDLAQPNMTLPFLPNRIWSYTGGPHSAWGTDGALSAIDFAPSSSEPGCVTSYDWVVASAPGLVVRSDSGVVMLDLDGDGNEFTGWNILYLHIASQDRVMIGTYLNQDDRIGHPSCEGGLATGTHVHIARKFNGEWILADGPLPMNLSGWIVHRGPKIYKGTMTNGDDIITSSLVGSHESQIIRK